MNIHGIIFLKDNNFPLIENNFIFKRLEEIPKKLLNSYGEQKEWSMRSFDARCKITDNPYQARSFGMHHAFSKSEIEQVFAGLNKKMEDAKIPEEKRMFILSKLFHQDQVLFSGHILKKDHFAMVDICEGNKPPSRDWTPHYSFKIDLLEKINVEESKYRECILRILNDLNKLNDGAYLDFALMKDGSFFYRDLYFHLDKK